MGGQGAGPFIFNASAGIFFYFEGTTKTQISELKALWLWFLFVDLGGKWQEIQSSASGPVGPLEI